MSLSELGPELLTTTLLLIQFVNEPVEFSHSCGHFLHLAMLLPLTMLILKLIWTTYLLSQLWRQDRSKTPAFIPIILFFRLVESFFRFKVRVAIIIIPVSESSDFCVKLQRYKRQTRKMFHHHYLRYPNTCYIANTVSSFSFPFGWYCSLLAKHSIVSYRLHTLFNRSRIFSTVWLLASVCGKHEKCPFLDYKYVHIDDHQHCRCQIVAY